MLDRIKEYLSSEDIEMVTLGARLLEKNIHHRQWAHILAECSKREEPIQALNNPRQTGYSTFTYNLVDTKWSYEIKKQKNRDERKRRTITINPAKPSWDWGGNGVWTQININNYKPVYTIKTGRGGMDVLNKAIETFMKQKKLPQKRPVRLTNKIKHK